VQPQRRLLVLILEGLDGECLDDSAGLHGGNAALLTEDVLDASLGSGFLASLDHAQPGDGDLTSLAEGCTADFSLMLQELSSNFALGATSIGKSLSESSLGHRLVARCDFLHRSHFHSRHLVMSEV